MGRGGADGVGHGEGRADGMGHGEGQDRRCGAVIHGDGGRARLWVGWAMRRGRADCIVGLAMGRRQSRR